MLEYIKKLCTKNEDKLFIAIFTILFTTMITASGFFIRYYYFPNNNNITDNDMSFDEYKKKFIKEITAKLTTAHNQEKVALEDKLKKIQQNNNDLKNSYKSYTNKVNQLIEGLKELEELEELEEFKKKNP